MALTLENLDRRTTALETAQGETTETLRWVVTKLARVQAVQDEHTLRLERLESKVDAMPRVMAEMIEASEKRLMEAMPRVMTEMIDASEKRLMAAIAELKA